MDHRIEIGARRRTAKLRGDRLATAACLVALSGALGAQRPEPQVPNEPPVTVPVSPEPAAWERRVGDRYENLGLAQVERLGPMWMLTILCRGVHSTYLEKSPVDPSSYVKGYVVAQYRYVDRQNQNVACVQGPCGPVTERRVVLDRLTRIEATPDQVRNAIVSCSFVQ